MAQQAVEHYHWLMPQEMLVGLGFAETNPRTVDQRRPVRGIHGGFPTPWSALPLRSRAHSGACSLLGPPSFPLSCGSSWAPRISKSVRNNKALGAALAAITAAVVGVILNLAIWFALHTLFGQV